MAMIRSFFWNTYQKKSNTVPVQEKKPKAWSWDEITNALLYEVLCIELTNAKKKAVELCTSHGLAKFERRNLRDDNIKDNIRRKVEKSSNK